MDQYRDAPFTPAQLKATYPDCLTFPSAEAFHTHIWSAMGLSEAACRLLHKIQSADAPSRLDDIFKQGVLGVPEALDLARTTVEDYERYDENFHAMDEKTRRMDTLRGIQQAYGEYAAARGKARAFEPVKPAVDGTVPAVLRDWALARMRGEVAVQLPADRAEQQNSEAEAKLLRRRTEDLRTRLDMIRGQMQGLDGGDLTRLELELDQARRTLEDVQANRTRIKQTFASIGETLPGDEQAWNERRINAVNFKREYNKRDGECEEALTAAINARAGARGDLERLQRDFDRQRSQRTRISQQMDETRAMLCRATGLTPAELPYVAELMDVNEHEEDWRLAMNVAYAPIAQTILVDKRHEQGFAAKVSTIDPRTMPRPHLGSSWTPHATTTTPARTRTYSPENRTATGCPANCATATTRPSPTGCARRPRTNDSTPYASPPSTTPTAPTVRCRPTVRSNPAHAASTAPKTAPRSSDSSTKPTSRARSAGRRRPQRAQPSRHRLHGRQNTVR